MARKTLMFALLILLAISSPFAAHANCMLGKLGELPVTMQGERPIVTVQINGRDVHLIADSGAFFSMLTKARAKTLGLSLEPVPYGLRVYGFGGEADTSMTTTRNFTLLGHPYRVMDFLVGGDNILTGDVSGLLGDNFLTTVDAEFDLANGFIRLFEAKGCGQTPLAYWVHDATLISDVAIDSSVPFHIVGRAKVNGHDVRVLFDTGTPLSILKLGVAARAGVNPKTPGAIPGGSFGGLGKRRIETWIVPVESFEMGGEQIKHTKLRIGDIELDDAEMVIGADFFLAHHIYFSKQQHRFYFTYNGGPVFDLRAPSMTPAEQQIKTASVSSAPPDLSVMSATDFARRGEASLARQQYGEALADLDQAVARDPMNSDYLVRRSGAHLGLHQPLLARADLDQALSLKPDQPNALALRGFLRLEAHDVPGAQTDFTAAEAAAKDDANIGLRIAAAYEEADQFALAVAEDDRWIKDHPTDDRMADAIDGRCWTYTLWNRELDTAVKDCDRAVRMSDGDHSSLDSRGLLHLRLGQWDAAIRDYNAALRLQPQSAWSLYGRGVAEMRKGQTAASQADLKLSTEIDPKVADRAVKLGFTPTP